VCVRALDEVSLGSKQITIKGLLNDLFSPASCLAIFVWASAFKAMLMEYIPIDFTALLGGILILSIGREVLINRRCFRVSLPFCLSYGMYVGSLLLSLTYTTAPLDVAKLKLLRLLVVDGLAVATALLLITDAEKLAVFVKAQIVIGLVLSLLAIASSVPGQWSLRGVGGATYITDGRAIGTALCLFLGMFGFRKVHQQVIALILVVGLVLLSARGPIIAAFMSCVLFMLYQVKNSRKLSLPVLIGLVAGAYVLILLDSRGYFFTIRLRLASLFATTEDASLSARMYFAKSASEMFLQKPAFGWGLSSFPFYAGCENVEEGPHNLILEFLCELGIVGVFAFVMMLIISIYRLHVIRKKAFRPVVEGLWWAFVFWIVTIPTLGLRSARPVFTLLAVINAPLTHNLEEDRHRIHDHVRKQ